MHFRLTLVQPRPGSEEEVERILEELDSSMANEPGMLMSMVLRQESPLKLGRVALWRSRDDADRLATSQHTLALRSHLQRHILPREGHVDSMLAVKSIRNPFDLENAEEFLAEDDADGY